MRHPSWTLVTRGCRRRFKARLEVPCQMRHQIPSGCACRASLQGPGRLSVHQHRQGDRWPVVTSQRAVVPQQVEHHRRVVGGVHQGTVCAQLRWCRRQNHNQRQPNNKVQADWGSTKLTPRWTDGSPQHRVHQSQGPGRVCCSSCAAPPLERINTGENDLI